MKAWFKHFHLSIAWKLSLLLLLTVLVPTVIVQLQLTRRYEDNLEQYVKSYLVGAFEETYNGIDRCMDEMKAQANFLFSSSALAQARQHTYRGFDRTLMEDHKGIQLAFTNCSRLFPDTQTNYTYLLEDGRIFGTWGTLAFPSDTEWLEQIQRELPSIGGYTWFSYHDEQNEAHMRPLGETLIVAKRLSMSPFASVLVSLSVDTFNQMFTPVETKNDPTRLMLFNRDGERMYANRDELSQKLNELVQLGLRSAGPKTELLRDGQRYVITRRLTANGWTLVRSLDDSANTLYGSSFGNGMLSWMMILFFCLLTAVMLAVVFRTTNGIKQLDGAVRRFSDNQEPQPLPVRGGDEVATLTLHFNELQERIKTLMLKAQKDEKDKMRLYYEAQIAEISPHFLYNTLNSIKWTAIFSGAQNVADLISSLGALLERQTSKFGETITVGETMMTLDHYMNLQYARFGERVHLEKDIPQAAHRLIVPKFCVQPLVENALLHGFEQQQRRGDIRVSLELRQDYLLLLVEDNGVGMPESRVNEILQELNDNATPVKRRSVGLQNVHRRIRYLYGAHYGLVFCTQEGAGTTMRLRLPVIYEPPGKEDPCIKS